ncbi:MAG: deoxyribose-phosphate aldolase [Flavobacteriales bacterium]|nr:deoxyribose-phosphate aldolase [Flavobacteriia bacterium]NCP07007.1 deoxyribose-phosphate aldolase [Flavobacteriales bacterium]PIV95060.1 MAG: deoxyribose-phosphate aldolase [Flavobacteriaceae bacterium CG17_big_fil_post_rev_8_21_14_2_50_33_15]PIY09284.1 MAG: deoxyribose-phosphate aldolase [Flavobacteriaceae bacterium CG_4_10_14_3_um_filter_33_47]PJB20258.1 MAG: deoxyribose-phosphate aldolase [Flavobacteriaceae bacterium CG_4_9_14_3_um_filter_33_16]
MKSLNKFIDHTLLKATATQKDIITLCKEAIRHDFFSVCINSCYVSLAKEQLKNTPVKICSVIGFPLGTMSTQSKVCETEKAIQDGADEIDMVMNVGFLKNKDYDAVLKDIEAVKHIMPNQTLKVILETCYLEPDEILKASELAIDGGADYIKTSTGFGTRGASFEDIKLMKQVAKETTKIKASGGIKDAETALKYINLGVQRLGTSSGIAIVNGETSDSNH